MKAECAPAALLVALVACHAPEPRPGDADDTGGPSDSADPVDSGESGDTADTTDAPPPRLDLAGSMLASSGHFSTALACSGCHGNADDATAMRDPAGRPIAPWDLWRASMMANAARDPFW